MERKNLYRFLSKKDNVLSLVTISFAVILIILDVFSDILNEQTINEIVIMLLTLIAITNLIERETRFTTSDKKIDDIYRLILKSNSSAFFSDDQLPSFKELARGASEFFVAGAHTFNLIMRNMDYWDNWLKEGKTLKILIQNPSNEGLKHLSIPTYRYKHQLYVHSINLVIEKLKSMGQHPNSNLQVKVSNACPTQGVLIVDGHVGGKIMIVAFYLPNCDSNSRPHIMLQKEQHSEWFNLFYSKYYEYLWEISDTI